MAIHQSALLLIEFQNEWLDERGKLGGLFLDKEQLNTSLKNAEKAIMAARKKSMPIVHSGLCYTKNYAELGQAKHGLRAAIPANKTFASGSFASQFARGFVPEDNEFVVQGRVGGSVFAGSNLDIYLRNNGINTLYIMGYALHVCVESTLRAAHDLGYDTIIIEDACSAFTKNQREYFLKDIVHHFGSTITCNDFLNLLNNAER